MQDQNNSPFANKTLIIGMLFFALFYYGWNLYLQKKYPGYGKKPEVTATTPADGTAAPVEKKADGAPTETAKTADSPDNKSVTKQEEKLFAFAGDKIAFQVTSRGLGLKNVEIKNYKDDKGETIKLGLSEIHGLFELKMADGSDVYFDVQEVSRGIFKGTYNNGAVKIERDLEFNESNNSFKSLTKVSSLNEKTAPSVKFFVSEKMAENVKSSWLFPSTHHEDFYVAHEGTSSSFPYSMKADIEEHNIKNVKVLSVGSQYFTSAVVDQSDTIPEVKLKSSVEQKTARAELTYQINDGVKEATLTQTLFTGPKAIDMMNTVHPELAQVFNFGWLTFIAKPLLYTMKWFFTIIPNWGVAIILLTLLVRLFVLPFNLMSYKSMKAMQKIQPLMTAVREKYKNDPVKMNQEVMNLMKENKANPLGGCLPMLLQIPIFFALYRVIGSSIELYGSPFIGWITDLSAYDHFFVLPILMGVTMFAQQKLTPTTMDPMQAKILMYMPLIFTVFMVSLPSGLTLYMFVSALFGVIQQYSMMRTKPA